MVIDYRGLEKRAIADLHVQLCVCVCVMLLGVRVLALCNEQGPVGCQLTHLMALLFSTWR